tara:strand:+ start:600 stop:830 length:231 start_codon:yes stop_codon:yes gene_type:complete
MSKINVNGIIRDMTPEEQEDYDKRKIELEERFTAEKNAKIKKEADAKTGNAKLLGLGLTQDEATALTGYKPPVEEE